MKDEGIEGVCPRIRPSPAMNKRSNQPRKGNTYHGATFSGREAILPEYLVVTLRKMKKKPDKVIKVIISSHQIFLAGCSA